MPFSEKFLESASKEYEVASVAADFEIATDYIKKAILMASKEHPFIAAKNIDIYIHGSYANKTNIWFPSSLEICVELKRTPHWTPDIQSTITPEPKTLPADFTPQYRLYNDYYVTHELDFSPKAFRDLLFKALSQATGEKCTENAKAIIIPCFGKLKHVTEITPCFSFNYHEPDDGGVFKGVLLYDESVRADIITFPRLHAQNGETKDLRCNGNFKRCVRLFKTINAITAREYDLEPERGYFIECLLFNVPNQMYRAKNLSEMFLKVINYLSNCYTEDFICQNMIWHLFGTAAEFWTMPAAHAFIKLMRETYKNFPASRTLLA